MKIEFLEKIGNVSRTAKEITGASVSKGWVDTPYFPVLPKYAGSITQTVITDCNDLTVTGSSDWLTISLSDGAERQDTITHTLTLNYTANTEKDFRYSSLIFTSGGISMSVQIIQQPETNNT